MRKLRDECGFSGFDLIVILLMLALLLGISLAIAFSSTS
jgi:hypothetical protein